LVGRELNYEEECNKINSGDLRTMKIVNKTPVGDTLFASCDDKYYKDHGKTFINSAIRNGNKVHIHLVNPSDESLNDAIKLGATTSYETTTIEGDPKIYYACSRFLCIAEFVDIFKDVRWMILDIDCLVLDKIEFPDAPVGLFFRHCVPAKERKVAAGVVYVGKGGGQYIKRVAEYIKTMKLAWFADQIALWEKSQTSNVDKIHNFDSKFMDWEFIEGTKIWTAKGPRKTDPTYLAKKKEFE